MIDLPDPVRRSAESQGPAGYAWLAALPGLVAELCQAWSLLGPGDALDGGKWAYVARVRVADGHDAVLKVALPTPGFARQLAMITAAAGRGYVRLYDADPARHALLMEPLGPMLSATTNSIDQILDTLGATLLEAWQAPSLALATLTPAGFSVVGGLIEILDEWPVLGKPCSPKLIALARGLLGRRAAAIAEPDTSVLCHGDPHADNALAVLAPRPGAESGFVFVDPDGFLCEPAYDLGVAMRGWTARVLDADDPVALTRGWSTRLATVAGEDEQAVWEWGLIQRVTSGLFLIRHGHQAEGRAFLASAERLV